MYLPLQCAEKDAESIITDLIGFVSVEVGALSSEEVVRHFCFAEYESIVPWTVDMPIDFRV